jgi:hypothetical protein
LLFLTALCFVQAQNTPNARQARRIFNNAYQQVFGEQGATLHYDVNIIGIYKTNGTIWYKGKKSKFVDEKMNSWNDGTTVYTIKKKKRKKEVEIHNAKNNKSDKYSSRFKFEPENFSYSIAEHEQGLMLTLKAKKGAKGIKEIHALVERKTYHPISLPSRWPLSGRPSRYPTSVPEASPTRCSVSPENSLGIMSLSIKGNKRLWYL